MYAYLALISACGERCYPILSADYFPILFVGPRQGWTIVVDDLLAGEWIECNAEQYFLESRLIIH